MSPLPLTCKRVDPAQDHYNYDDLDIFCRCDLCIRYFEAVEQFEYFLSLTPGHRWHCACILCNLKRSCHQTQLAEGSRRDLYCELSFLTHTHPFSDRFLPWVLGIVRDDSWKTEAWWANHAQKRPLSAWMVEWQKKHLTAAVIAVSGMC